MAIDCYLLDDIPLMVAMSIEGNNTYDYDNDQHMHREEEISVHLAYSPLIFFITMHTTIRAYAQNIISTGIMITIPRVLFILVEDLLNEWELLQHDFSCFLSDLPVFELGVGITPNTPVMNPGT